MFYCINKSESMCMLFDVSLCSTLKELSPKSRAGSGTAASQIRIPFHDGEGSS